MDHPRFTITVLILFAIISGLYMYSRLSLKEIPLPITIIPQIPFDGMVPKEITHGDTSKKQIIFTFDGGDGAQSATKILEVLAKHHVTGTFFLTGEWVKHNPDLVKIMHDEGHEIFNHTYNHPHLTTLSDEQITAELVDMDTVLFNLIGTSTKPYFRPPYGDRDIHVLKVAARAGFRSIYWTIDAHDWMESEGTTAAEVTNQILYNLQPGMIILMHVGDTITGTILDNVFTTIENKGYKLVSLTQGL